MSEGNTPSQTVGPYFSIGFSWITRADLTRGTESGELVTIRGRVLDGEGQPVPDACLEIWQADGQGRYAQAEDSLEKMEAKRFWGFGRVPTNQQGEFSFTTLRPGPVPGPDGRLQAPHLVISVFMRGLLERLITRMYFPVESGEATDAILELVPRARRKTLIARAGGAGNNLFDWDVCLQGEQETVFFDC